MKLNRLVQGELDWIVMKALEKDRNRRYETANGFAADIERYLHDETGGSLPAVGALSSGEIRAAEQSRVGNCCAGLYSSSRCWAGARAGQCATALRGGQE